MAHPPPNNPTLRRPIRSTEHGVSIIEVMIALLVLSIGLLGLAALQGFSLQNFHGSYHHTQATNLAHEMFDHMRANRTQALAAGATVWTDVFDREEFEYNDQGNIWLQRLAALPGCGASPDDCISITFDNVDAFTITIEWFDDRRGDEGAADGLIQNFEFTSRI